MTIPSNGDVSIIRSIVKRMLDHFDPPKPRAEVALLPCPVCENDLSKRNEKFATDSHDLRYYLCPCGHASAWYWEDDDPQLVYGGAIAETEDDD